MNLKQNTLEILKATAIFILSLVVISVALVCLALFFKINPLEHMILFIVVQDMIWLLVFILAYLKIWQQQVRYDFKLPKKQDFIRMVVAIVITLAFSFIMSEIFNPEPQQILQGLSKLGISVILVSSVIVPITEEIIFRGILGRAITNEKVFIVTSGVLFGLCHIQFSGDLISSIMPVLVTSLFGFILAHNYIKSGHNILATIITHSVYNAIVFLLVIFVR